jgi:hypothetical protein
MTNLGDKCHKIVVERRDRIYTKWVRDEETNKWIEVECGRGWEIVREISSSEKGVEIWNGLSPEAQKSILKMNVNDRIHLGL